MIGKLRAICLDVETMHLTPEEIKFEEQWLKPAANTKDPAKRAAQVAEKALKLVEKDALTNSCSLGTIGFQDVFQPYPAVLHAFPEKVEAPGIECFQCASQKEMLENFTSTMNLYCDENTEIVVADKYFDLPKIRLACVRHRVPIPEIFLPGAINPVFDVLQAGSRYFLINNVVKSLSLRELCARLGIKGSGKIISGADVPDMIDRGEYQDVIIYNASDVLQTAMAYRLMTNQ